MQNTRPPAFPQDFPRRRVLQMEDHRCPYPATNFFFILGVPPGAFSRRPGVGLLRAPRRSGNPFGRSAASGQCRRGRPPAAPHAPPSASLTHTPAPLSPSSFALYLPSLFGV
ncbi:MAG: hypothetical protein NZM15_07930 [Flavobacteriales bacterium]|nr:hypothetical protein [Flavobacteriales bacterium]MDW8432615.1 hypothetical protein [Flavobacteriales bacterium]